MRAIAAGVTDVGRERDINEDRFVLLPEFEVFVVADGMGGHQCGEVASRMATSIVASYFRVQRQQTENGQLGALLHGSVAEANARIHERAIASTLHRGMGTTIVAAAFSRRESRVYLAHAGDSRCYRVRDGCLERLTRDHSLVEEAMRSRPDMTQNELSYLPANVITRALGVESTVDIEVSDHRVLIGDMYLLCSDGLHGFANDDRILRIITGTDVLTTACGELVAEANRNGGGDNITAVLVRIEEHDEPWAATTSSPPVSEREPFSRRGSSVVSPPTRSRAQIEADDTAEMTAITDPDAILARLEKP
jgi:PPM family protein phosphatase